MSDEAEIVIGSRTEHAAGGRRLRRRLLDHGYVELIDVCGSDQRVIEAARMSTDKGFLGWGGAPCPQCDAAGRLDPKDRLYRNQDMFVAARAECVCKGSGVTVGDEKLLRYLWEHRHTTPFEMGWLHIEVQAPLFVFREWHRHRTQSYSELSARYTQMPDLHYLPLIARCRPADTANRQAAGTAPYAGDDAAQAWIARARALQTEVYSHYTAGLALGISKEVARLNTPVARYSRMRAGGNLLNWLRFLGLRMAPDAQWEIRQYADAVGEIVAEHFPRTWALFEERPL